MPALAFRSTLPRPDDPDIIQRFTDAVRKGHPYATAATLAGISHDAASSWLNKGNQLLVTAPLGIPLEELGSHAVFAVAVKLAEAEMVEAKLSIVERDMATPGKGWLPAMTLLERRRPQDFGRGPRGESVTTHQTLVVLLPEATERHVLDLLRERLEGGRPLLPEHNESTPQLQD